MKKHRIAAGSLALLILTVSLLAGCTGGPSDPAQKTAVPTAEPIELDVPEAVTLAGSYPFKSMLEGAESKLNRLFYKKGSVTAVKVGTHYGFYGLAKQELAEHGFSARTMLLGDRVYTTAYFLAGSMGFDYSESGDVISFAKGSVSFSFKIGDASVSFGEEKFPVYPPQKTGNHVYFDCESFARVTGQKTYFDSQSGIYLMYPEEIEPDTGEQISLYTARYDLYERVVYNIDDVACDTTGSGLYQPVDFGERQVGIAYTTWHRASSSWDKKSKWDVPLLGGYRSEDKDVIYRHGIWLRDAGVDFVFVDWSNNINYDPATMRSSREDFRTIEEATELLFEVWATIPGAPKICIFNGPGHVQQKEDTFANGRMKAKCDQIYDTFIANEEFNKMYYYYDGKPLMPCYSATPSFNKTDDVYVDDRFTMRWITGYVGQQSSLFDKETLVSRFHWSWEERGTQTFTVYNGKPEAMTIVASWRKQSSEGKPGYIAPGLRNDGETFRMQWARADLIGVKLALIVSFNEWSIGEQISLENSKDIEPSKTYGTLYLDIMKEQIKKFKGQTDEYVSRNI